MKTITEIIEEKRMVLSHVELMAFIDGIEVGMNQARAIFLDAKVDKGEIEKLKKDV